MDLGVVAHTFDPSTSEACMRYKFEANLIYIMSSRIAKPAQQQKDGVKGLVRWLNG